MTIGGDWWGGREGMPGPRNVLPTGPVDLRAQHKDCWKIYDLTKNGCGDSKTTFKTYVKVTNDLPLTGVKNIFLFYNL